MNSLDFSNVAFGLATLLGGGYGIYLGIQKSDLAAVQLGLGQLAGGAVQIHAGWNGQRFVPSQPVVPGYRPPYTLLELQSQMPPTTAEQVQVLYPALPQFHPPVHY